MPTNKETFKSKMNALANSINAKAGTTGAKDLDELKTAVDSIPTGSPASFQKKAIHIVMDCHADMEEFPSFPCSVTLSFVINSSNYSDTPKTIAETTITFNDSSEFDYHVYKEVVLDLSNVTAYQFNYYTNMWLIISTADWGEQFDITCQRIEDVDFANEYFPIINRGSSYGSTYDRTFGSAITPSSSNYIMNCGHSSTSAKFIDNDYIKNSELLVKIHWNYYED